ncbi:hypothetical protein FRB94_006136 [Tulasnella sp. JGI-2019a]|nr:hypothetical protein FRB94_006136 [Tulasnella sp. JGI-2019a]
MKNYRCEVIMQALGTVLQISLLLFFLALTIWLWGINHTIGIIVILGVVMTIAFYLITTVISIYDPASPFSTRFSAILRELGHFAKTTDALIATGMDELDGKCMTWISNNATMFESVAGMARVATYLPDDIRRDERLDHTHVGPKLLRSIISSNAIRLGLTNGNLFSTVNTIRNAMTSWEGVPISLACDVLAQLHEILRTTVYKDPVVSESIALILEHVDIDIPSDLLVQTRRPAYETLVDLVLIPSLTLEGKRAALSILWRYSLSLCTLMWPGNTPETPVPTEGEWQWKVVCVLVDTASANGMDDPSMERLEFRVAWAAALSRKTLDVRRLLYNGPREEHDPSASLWLRSFGERQFECYLIDRVQISQFRMENRIDLHKAAMDCLVLRTSIFIPRAFIIPPPDDQTSFLELGFDVDKEYKPEFIAALYEWYLNQKCSARSYPTSFISKQYVRFAILEFLEEQLGPKP